MVMVTKEFNIHPAKEKFTIKSKPCDLYLLKLIIVK